MSLTELLPSVRELTRNEKIRLIQVLADDLVQEESPPMPAGEYPIWSPYDSYEAADQLQRLIDANKAQS
jgi:hypothetical protein